MKIFKAVGDIALGLSGWLIAVPIMASDLYLGARAGYSHNHHSCADWAMDCDRSDVGVGIFAGSSFNKSLAIELSVSDLGDSSAVYPDVSLEGELTATDISLKYQRPFYQNSRIFVNLGAAYWRGEVVGWGVELQDSGVRPTAGVGIEFPLSNQLGGRLEYRYFDRLGNRAMGYTNSHWVGLALIWKF